jgi:hypothetical protein
MWGEKAPNMLDLSNQRTLYLVLAFCLAFLAACDDALDTAYSRAQRCPDAEKIKTAERAVAHAKRTILDKETSYRSDPNWVPVYNSDVYRQERPLGVIIAGKGWIVGEIKDEPYYYFSVGLNYKDEWRDAATFVEMNRCGHVRDHGFSMSLSTITMPAPK